MEDATLRRKILRSLQSQGFTVRRGKIVPPDPHDKSAIRALHDKAVQSRIDRAASSLRRYEDRLISHIADGPDIDPLKIEPRLITVRANTEWELLFRYARLHWSIPVSAGYGRRVRFLVYDAFHKKLIGVIGLGDPVAALGPRDISIGWNTEQRRRRLQCVMDAFVLGAVPPYSNLLCGKLVALLASSNEVRRSVYRKYHGRRTLISRRKLDGRLALITTASALGRSSIYNRLRYENIDVFQSVGFTRGSGEFHFANGVYSAILKTARDRCEPTAKHARWGTGFRNRREVVRRCLRDIGMSPDLLYHGVAREVFLVENAQNTGSFLRCETNRLNWFDRPAESLIAYFRKRWLLPRAQWDQTYRLFRSREYRLWS